MASIALASLTLVFLAVPLSARGERPASPGESREMWATVFAKYGLEGCVKHRGEISTAKTKRMFGIVTVADAHCGNGQFILSTRRHAAHRSWRVLGAGSDWGAPERCASDLRRIPRPVLEDFFTPDFCRNR